MIKTIIASLPTRSNKAPALMNTAHGCVNHDNRCFNCYVFEEKRVICNNGFAFDMNTYVYGNEVEDYEMETLNSVYAIEGVDYTVEGVLTPEEYKGLYQSLSNSSSIKRKIKRLLQ